MRDILERKKFNYNGGRYMAGWSPKLQRYIMSVPSIHNHRNNSMIYEISENEYEHFDEEGFNPLEHQGRFLFSTAYSKTQEQQFLYDIFMGKT